MPGKLYEVLELSKKNVVTKADIKRQYHRLAKITHPDKSHDNGYKFKCINKAYLILSDDNLKKTYDKDPARWDNKIFSEDGSVNIPQELKDDSALLNINSGDSNLDELISKMKEVNGNIFDDLNGYFNKLNNVKIESKIYCSSFNALLNELLVDYGKVHEGNFIFSRSHRAYVVKFNSIISSVANEFCNNQGLLAQTYTAWWLLTIMSEGKQKFMYEQSIGGEKKALQEIFENIKVKKALSEAAKLIKKNEFLSRLLLLQYINNNLLHEPTQKQTEEALKFGIGQLYYHKESINAVMNVDWKGAGYHYHLSLVLLKVVLKNFVPYTIIATLCVASLGFFFATPVVAMTTLGLMVSCLMAATVMIAPLVGITLLAASIAMLVFAKKFGNAMQQEKLKIKTTIKETTHKKLENSDHYSFFHKSICSIATKSKVDKISENSTENSVSGRERLTYQV